jgi:thiamine-phosphate pyrophosphorylase
MLLADFSLYLITDRHLTAGRPLMEVVRHSLEGGVKAVQLREKDVSSAELYRIGEELRRLTSNYDATLIINDRLDIALAVDADGLHLGINSMPIAKARKILGSDKIIGYSSHAIDEALQAQSDGADFITFGPVFFTPSKASYGEPCGVKALTETVDALKIPVFALGGVSPVNICEALSSNIHGVAVISAIMAAQDPFSATASLLKTIEAYAKHS